MGNYRGSCIIIIITIIIIIHGHLSVREADQTSLVAIWPISELTQNIVNTCNDSIGFTKPLSKPLYQIGIFKFARYEIWKGRPTPAGSGVEARNQDIYGSFRKFRVRYFGIRIIRILLFRVLYPGPLFSETPILVSVGGLLGFACWGVRMLRSHLPKHPIP